MIKKEPGTVTYVFNPIMWDAEVSRWQKAQG